MKTTLDGVVFLLPHVSSHAKTEFHRRRIFPGPREEGGNGMRRPGESCRTRTVGRQNEAAERGSKMDGRTGRQNGAQNKAAEQGGKTDRQDETAGRSGKTEQQDGAAGRGGRTGLQDGAAGRGGRTGRQDGAAGRGGRTERQDGAAGRSSRTERQDGAAGRSGRKRGGGQSRVIAADRSGGAACTNKKRARPSVPPVLAPGFQPPEAAGQRKSARRSGPASAKGQCTGSQYAVRTPGRVQYYSHGRR